MGLDGNLYYTVNNPNKLRHRRQGRHQDRRGEVPQGQQQPAARAATAHGLVRDGEGNFWFDVNPGRRGLGKLDVKTEKITVYQTPNTMSPLGGAVTMDVDGKGKIWASAPGWRAAVRPGDREVHRLQVDDAVQERQGHQHDLRRRRRPRRQRLVGADGVRHHRQGRHRDRQGDRRSRCRRSRTRSTARRRRRRRSTTASTTAPTATRCRGRKARAAWAPTRTPTCCGSAIRGARRSRASTPRRSRPRSSRSRSKTHAALPHRGRQEPQRVGQLWTSDRIAKIRPGHQQLDHVRTAGARHRNPPRLADRA